MKRLEKQLPNKANFVTSLQFICANFKLNGAKGLGVCKVLKEIQFEEVWPKLEAKLCFQRLSANFYFAFYVFISCSN